MRKSGAVFVKYVFLFVWLYFLIELSIRSFFVAYYEIPFFAPKQIIYHYYPQVKRINQQYAMSPASKQKILVLSSSALTDEWGRFQENLQSALDSIVGPEQSEVFNASGVGFSSSDNLNTYQLLSELSFDKVVFYNAINDMRFNNCPDEVYENDYTHAFWNNEIDCIFSHSEMNYTVVPFFFDFIYQVLYQQFNKEQFIPDHYSEKPEWLKYGRDFKSLKSFRKYLDKILKEIPDSTDFYLFSFAYFIPENYSLEGFNNRSVAYNFHTNSREVENWGKPENVAGFLEASYTIVDSLAQKYEHSFYPIHLQMDRSLYFADVCHYSPEGMDVFANRVAVSISKDL